MDENRMEELMALLMGMENKSKKQSPKDNPEFQENMRELLEGNEHNPGLTPEVIEELETRYSRLSEEFKVGLLIMLLNNWEYEEEITKIKEVHGTISRICGKRFTEGAISWSCRTCEVSASESNTCWCDSCFIPERHIGHDTLYTISWGGCCDCGDSSCLKPTSYCPEHTPHEAPLHSTASLPTFLQEGVDVLIAYLHKMLNLIMARGAGDEEVEVEVRGLEPLDEENIIMLTNAMVILNELSDCSTFLRDKIKELIMSGSTMDSMTLHFCVDQLHDVSALSAATLLPHICTCSMVDNIMKYLTLIGDNSNTCAFMAEMAKQDSEFRLAVFTAFFANYAYVGEYSNLREDEKMATIESVMSQCRTIHDEDPTLMPFLKNPNLRTQYIDIVGKKCDELISRTADFPDLIMMGNLKTDFTSNIKERKIAANYLISNTDFYDRFLSICERVQFADQREKIETSGIDRNYLIGYMTITPLTELFAEDLVNINFDNQESLKKIALLFRQALLKSIDKFQTIQEKYYLYIPLNWIFSIFLTKFIGKCWVKREMILDINKLKEFLMEIFEFDSESAFCDFLDIIGQITLRHINFILEIMSGLWNGQGTDMTDQIVKIYFSEDFSISGWDYDLALIQIIYSLISSDTLNNWVCENIQLDEKIDAQKIEKLKEARLYYMAAILSNDTAIPKLTLLKKMNWFGHYSKSSQKMLDFVIKKQAVRQIIGKKDKEKIKAFNIMEIVNSLNHQFKRADEAEGIIREMCEPTETASGQKGSKLTNMGLAYFNTFSISHLKDFFDSELVFKEYLKFEKITELDLLHNSKQETQILFILQALQDKQLMRGVLEIMIEKFNSIEGFEIGSKLFVLKIIYTLMHALLQNPAKYENIFLTKIQDIEPFSKNITEFKQVNREYRVSCDNLVQMLSGFFPELYKENSQASLEKTISGDHKSKMLAAKDRQAEIMAKFAEKREGFMRKLESGAVVEEIKENMGMNELEKDVSKTAICCHCKETLYLDSLKEYNCNPFGRCVCIAMNNIIALKNRSDHKYAVKYLEEYNPEGRIYSPYLHTAIKGSDPNICLTTTTSCGHYLHYQCLNQYKSTNKSLSLQGIFTCPFCKYYSHALAPQFPLTTQKVDDLAYLCTEEYLKCLYCKDMNQVGLNGLKSFEDMSPDLLGTEIFNNGFKSLSHELEISTLLDMHKYLKSGKLETLQILIRSLILYETVTSRQKNREEAHAKIMENLSEGNPQSMKYDKYIVNGIFILFEFITKQKSQSSQIIIEDINLECPEFTKNIEKGLIFLFEQALIGCILNKERNLERQIALISTTEIIDLCYADIEIHIIRYLERFFYLKGAFESWNSTKIEITIEELTSSNKLDYLMNILSLSQGIRDLKANSKFHLNSPETQTRIKSYLRNIEADKTGEAPLKSLLYVPLTPPLKLFVNLLPTYDEVFLKEVRRICQHCKKDNQKSKCMCLMCGDILCAKTECCQFTYQDTPVGELHQHMLTCEYGIGLFLSFYEGQIIALTKEHSTVFPAPYRNEFNESIMDYLGSRTYRFVKSTDFRKYKLVEGEMAEWGNALGFGKVLVLAYYQTMKTGRSIVTHMV